MTAAQIAQAQGTAITAVRSQIRQDIGKLGVGRAADVVRLLRQGEALWSAAGIEHTVYRLDFARGRKRPSSRRTDAIPADAMPQTRSFKHSVGIAGRRVGATRADSLRRTSSTKLVSPL
jgi:hypothetical protein